MRISRRTQHRNVIGGISDHFLELKPENQVEALQAGVSPCEGGLDDGHVPVDLGAVPEGLDVGGINGHGVHQSADADAVAGWRETNTGQAAASESSSRSRFRVQVQVCTFGTRSVTLFTPLDTVLLHFVPPGPTGADARAARHHVVIYRQTEGKLN